MYFAIETRPSWDLIFRITPALLEELRFWYTNIECLNGYSIRTTLTPRTVIFSDASELGSGGYVATLDNSIVWKILADDDFGKRSTYISEAKSCLLRLFVKSRAS